MPELEKKTKEQEKELQKAPQEKKAGFLSVVVFLMGLVLIIFGMGYFEPVFGAFFQSQLQAIYSTAMTLCLSCIGLGKIKFATLLDLSIIFAVFVMVYKLLGVRNVSKQ